MAHAEFLRLSVFLPEPAYDLWVAGELDEILGVPNDGTRVEIIGGEIVVSPAASFGHNAVANYIQKLFGVAEATREHFPWEMGQGNGLNVAGVRDGFIPDLLCLKAEVYERLQAQTVVHLFPEHVTLAVEVTSPSNAKDDRKPGPDRERPRPTKWAVYAYEGIPFYLLVDRDPEVLETTLYSDPDRDTGTYRSSVTWPFGKTVTLPEPFDIEIPTVAWGPWEA